jgi:hypothetical protein
LVDPRHPEVAREAVRPLLTLEDFTRQSTRFQLAEIIMNLDRIDPDS